MGLFLRNESYALVGEIDDYQVANFDLKHNDVGRWQIELPAASPIVSELSFLHGIVLRSDDDQSVLFSGPIDNVLHTYDKDTDKYVIGGPDDNVWLKRRVALPNSTAPYTSSAYDTSTGIGSTVMRHYVTNNLGTGAAVERRLPSFTVGSDPLVGTSITGNARFHNLLDLEQRLALAAGDITFRVIQVGAGLEFQVYEPTDLSATAIFSVDLGNLSSFDIEDKAAEANYVYVGGGGELTARTFYEQGDSTSISEYGRTEHFLDQRQTAVTAELAQAATTELAEKAQKLNIAFRPTETDSLRFPTHYGLGDRVTAVMDGVAYSDLIRALSLRYESNEAKLERTGGNADDLGTGQMTSTTSDGEAPSVVVVGTPRARDPKQFLGATLGEQHLIRKRQADLERNY